MLWVVGLSAGGLSSGPAFAQEDSVAVAPADAPAIVDSLEAAMDTIQEAHPQDSPEETGFVFAAPDGKGSFRLRASIRLNGAWDFSGLRSTDVFDTFLIPVGESLTYDQARFFMQATQSRFGFELNRDTGNGIVFGRIETDFRGEGNSLRLRHAYGEFWRFLAGQTWSTFTDVTTLPVTVDLEGPPSSNSVRTPQIRYAVSPAEGWKAALALEAPQVDATVVDSTDVDPGTFENFQGFGDIAARLRRETGWGHLTVSTIFRSITLQDREQETQLVPGLGLQASGTIDLDGDDQLLFQVIGGRAISRFVGSLGGKGLDVILNPESGSWEAIVSYGGYVTYSHRWENLAPGVISNFTVGGIGIAQEDWYADDFFNYSFYFATNAFWQITTGARFGGELSWGQRNNKDGTRGNALRFSFAAYFDF
ncbi:MAG: DcaP family trimeric outer membrane transporter [marine benthic group bacterium]|nr:DcaP family trimeric outer membrane transporter [Gemmatimonadota bacterium]